jgi:hypothetical protein
MGKRIAWAIRAYCASCKEGWYMVRCRYKEEAKALAEKFGAYSQDIYLKQVEAGGVFPDDDSKIEEALYVVEPLPKGKKAEFDSRKYDTNNFIYGCIDFVHIFRGFASRIFHIPPIPYTLPGCLNEPGNSEPNQENFDGHNAFRARRGQPPVTFEEYLEWHKT